MRPISIAAELALQDSLKLPAPQPKPSLWRRGFEWARNQAWTWAKENPYLVFLAAWGALRAMGATVKTGNTGLFFNLGHATRVLEPGFYFKIPYFQKIKTLPSRSRTLDVPDQRVTSSDGLVWFVDVNLVYRIVDVRKALVQIDDLIGGMTQMLGLSVQEIVRDSERSVMRQVGGLDQRMTNSMAARLAAWGVEVESVGFTSIRPSPKTLRFTQQKHTTAERYRALRQLEAEGLGRSHALAMLGAAPMPQRRAWRAARREALSRRRRGILRAVRVAGVESKIDLSASLRAHLRRAATAHLGQATGE